MSSFRDSPDLHKMLIISERQDYHFSHHGKDKSPLVRVTKRRLWLLFQTMDFALVLVHKLGCDLLLSIEPALSASRCWYCPRQRLETNGRIASATSLLVLEKRQQES